MDYDVFKNLVLEQLEADIPEPKTISVQILKKNNGIVHDGVVIREGSINITPVIHLDFYYDMYCEGCSFQEAYNDILEKYYQNKSAVNIDMDFFSNFQSIKNTLAVKLINYEENSQLLTSVPYRRFLDLAIVFYSFLPMAGGSGTNATILIRSEHISQWGVTTDELYNIAMGNAMRIQPPKLDDINNVVEEITGGMPQNAFPQNTARSACPMFILSNESNLFGASCILYNNLLKSFADSINMDFFVLPSSIHEVILVPTVNCEGIDDLSRIVRDVNATQLQHEEILSNHAYYFSREENLITM